MKKHNEAKSIKGIRLNKGKILCKALSFTMIFVMLFCISASAVLDYTDISVNIYDKQSLSYKNKKLDMSVMENTLYYNIVAPEGYEIYYETTSIELNTEAELGHTVTYLIGKRGGRIYVSIMNIPEDAFTMTYSDPQANEIIHTTYNIWIGIQNGEEITLPEEIYIESPAYEGFIGNAKGMFDLIFESMQSIFNWFVSPNVIVFFGLGIILSLSTIGILIARRFFWGR